MPTESTFLFAGLLFLAAALGYVFARFGDADDEEEAEASARTNFLRGFRYLLNEESDRAVDLFTGANDLSDDAMETQLALGTLFRRRGEIDRAIRLHQNLVERQSSSVAQREAASFALAEDYLGAGLFDRAEEIFIRLRDSRVHGVDALKRLLRICEVTSDWDRAVDLCAELNRLGPGNVSRSQLAHYYCELAEQARLQKAPELARQMLTQAEVMEPGKVRAVLISADLAADSGRVDDSIDSLSRLGSARPNLLGEVLPRLMGLASAAEHRGRVAEALRQMGATPDGLRGIALGVIRDPRISDPMAIEYLATFVSGQPVLSALLSPEDRGSDSLAGVARLRPLLHKVLKAGMRFQCGNCGYGSAVMHWQCPGCRSWDTVQPTSSGVLEGILS
ncbi:MAG: tetratricopeptide repeat protein [Chromatiales bacterium]|nr:tetratricopeptide repeat protein [Chromatiales bacterium]